MKLRNLFALVALAGLLACGPTESPTQPEPGQNTVPAPPEAVSAPPAGMEQPAMATEPAAAAMDEEEQPEATVATVGGEKITNRDLSLEMQMMEQRYAGQIPPEYMAQMRPRFRQQALSQLVRQTMVKQAILAEAARQNIAPTSEEVDAALAKFKSQVEEQGATMDMFLQVRGWSQDELRQQLATDLVSEELLDRIAGDISDASVVGFYEANKERMAQPPQMRASHILFSTADRQGNQILPLEVARASAETVLGWIRAGSDFAELAREYSMDPGSAVKGGDLGFFPEGQMVGPFNDAVVGMATDEVSGLIPTEFGFHIIKKTGATAGGVPSLLETEEMIRGQLQRQVMSQWLEGQIEKMDMQASYANPADAPENQAPPGGMPGGSPRTGGSMR